MCAQCSPKLFCKHGKQKYFCVECQGLGICEHGAQRRRCKNCNPVGFLAQKIRMAVHNGLRRRFTVKDKYSLQILGVDSWGQFEAYWQRKIDSWNQNNPDDKIDRQTTVADHIKPVCAFRDFAHGNPNHHTNLQPIPAGLNLAKRAKWAQIDEDYWKMHIYENPECIRTYLPHEMSRGLANSFFGPETPDS